MDYSAYIFNKKSVSDLVKRSNHPLKFGFETILLDAIRLIIDGDEDLYELVDKREEFSFNVEANKERFFDYLDELKAISKKSNGEWANQDMVEVHEHQYQGPIIAYKAIIKQCIDSLVLPLIEQSQIEDEVIKLVSLSRQLGEASQFDSFQDAFLLREDFHYSRNHGLAKANTIRVDGIKPVKELSLDLASAIWCEVPTLSVNKTAEIIHDNIQKVLDDIKEYECRLFIKKGLFNRVPKKKNKENDIIEEHHPQSHRTLYFSTDEYPDDFLVPMALKTADSIRRYIETVKPSQENIVAYRKTNPNQKMRDKINTAQKTILPKLKCEDKSCRCKKY